MKTTAFTILFVLFAICLFSQTIIPDGERVSGKWTKAGSPYIIEGEAIVPKGQTLTIMHGVEIQFKVGNNYDYRIDDKFNPDFDMGLLRVNGTIIAKGKKNDMIHFTGQSNYATWGTVFMVNSSDNVFEYCHFEKSHFVRLVTIDDNSTGAITFINSFGNVINCIIENSWSGINCKQGSAPNITNCIVYNNQYGIESNSKSRPIVKNTIIWSNGNAFYVNADANVKISYSLIQDDEVSDGIIDRGNNIFGKDPKMNNEFGLKNNSPCKKNGEKKKNMGLL